MSKCTQPKRSTTVNPPCFAVWLGGEVFAESVLRDIRAFEQALRSLEGAEIPNGLPNQRRERKGDPQFMGMVEKETRGFLGVLVCLFFFFLEKRCSTKK